MINIGLDQLNYLLLHKQHLIVNSKTNNIIQTVEDMGGLHATSATTPYLSLFARTQSLTRDSLDNELYAEKRLGKIRCMRGTIYILPKEMIPAACAATRRLLEPETRRYLEFRGVPYEKYEEASKLILITLKGREMSAPAIRKTLKMRLDLSSILYLMCDQGLLIRGRPRKYALFREYFPDIDLAKVDEDEATAFLVQRYLHAFGPATEDDIAWWIGLSTTRIRQALTFIQDLITRVKIAGLGENFLTLTSDEELVEATAVASEDPAVNLLPVLDPYLMGYKERERYLSREHYSMIFDRTGNATSTILLNGRVVGVWDFAKEAEPTVKLYFLREVEEDASNKIFCEAERIGRFISGREAQIRKCNHMVPLTRRTAGGIMSPLKDAD